MNFFSLFPFLSISRNLIAGDKVEIFTSPLGKYWQQIPGAALIFTLDLCMFKHAVLTPVGLLSSSKGCAVLIVTLSLAISLTVWAVLCCSMACSSLDLYILCNIYIYIIILIRWHLSGRSPVKLLTWKSNPDFADNFKIVLIGCAADELKHSVASQTVCWEIWDEVCPSVLISSGDTPYLIAIRKCNQLIFLHH